MALIDFTGIGSVASLVEKILEFIPNAEQRAKAASAVQDLISKVAEQQTEINKIEAANANWFVSGWRPAAGWIAVGALAYSTIIAPAFHLGLGGTETLITLLFGMLGLGSLRTIEKVKGK